MYAATIGGQRFAFPRLVDVLAHASPLRSGDQLSGVAAGSATERVAAQMALADIPLRQFVNEAVIPYEADEVTRLIFDSHDAKAFRTISHLTVGVQRQSNNWSSAQGTARTDRAAAIRRRVRATRPTRRLVYVCKLGE